MKLQFKKTTIKFVLLFGWLLLFTGGKLLIAQETSSEEIEMISPNVELVGIQKADNSIDLKASVKAKVNGKIRKMHSLKIHFFIITDTSSIEVGAMNADNSGTAVFSLKPEQALIGSDGFIKCKAVVNSNKNMDEGEAEISFKKAILTVTPSESDGLKTLDVKLIEITKQGETPVANITVGIYVDRTFKPLKIAEGTTDETGMTSIEFPNNLPGNEKGNLIVYAKVDEDENYGNLEASFIGEKWGTTVSKKHHDQPRALWSSHPPLWMLITFIVLMVAVWGHYIVIVYELFRLRNEKPSITNS